jgi:protein-tyrosine phosphatase
MPSYKTTPIKKNMQSPGGRTVQYPDEAFFGGNHQNYQQETGIDA